MRTRRVMLGGMLLGLLPALSLPALPARADALYFGFSSGPSHRRHHDRYDRHWPPPHAYRPYAYRPYAYRETWIYSDPYPRHYYPPARHAPYAYVPPPPVYPQRSMQAVPASPVYRTAQGQYCREYQGMIQVQGMMQPSFGTACLMPDGVWRIVN